jgi:hypothetical protein
VTGIRLGVEENEYHAHPAFSYSQAKVLLESPARYKWQQDNGGRPGKREYDYGHTAHAKVLGVGLDIAVIEAADWRTKAAREAAEEARAEGKAPILRHEADRIDLMAQAIEAHPQARRILTTEGEVEASIFWTDADTGVECRGRVDKLAATDSGLVNVDYKSTTDASPSGFAQLAARFRYHLQAATYDDGLRHITGEGAPCVLIAQEKEPPYLVGFYTFSDWDMDRGLDLWRDALDLLVKCRADNEWPGYPDAITELALPSWA